MHAGAPGLILDNENGCVVNGIANGSRCIMKSLAWDDADVNQQIIDGISSCESDIYDLPRYCIGDGSRRWCNDSGGRIKVARNY